MSLSILLADDSKFIRRILSKELPDIFPGKHPVLTEAATVQADQQVLLQQNDFSQWNSLNFQL